MLLVKAHGGNAEAVAAQHVDERLAEGDLVERTLRTGVVVSGIWTRNCAVVGGQRINVAAVLFEALEVRCSGQLALHADSGTRTYLYEADLLYAPDHDLVLQSTNKFTDQSTNSTEKTEAKLFSIMASTEAPPTNGDPNERIHCFFKSGEPMIVLPRNTCQKMGGSG